MKESGSSRHGESYHTGQTVKTWSGVSPAENVQKEWRDSAEARAWRKEEREQKIKQIWTMRRKKARRKGGDCQPVHQQRD